MDFPFVLAQERAVNFADRLFEKYPPVVAVPASIAALIVTAFILEKVIVAATRQVTSRTKTKVDDAFAEGLPSILRPFFFLAGLHIAINVLLRKVKGESSELTPAGQKVQVALYIVAALVLVVCATRVALRMVDAWVATEPARARVGPAIKFAIKVVAVPIAGFAAAKAANLHLSGALTALGVGSLAVGLALQDLLKNIVAGIQLVLDQPARAGDFIQLDQNTKGTVIEVGLRSTKLRSPDNNTIIIPNSTVANAIIVNVDHTDRATIQAFEIGVAYGSDTRRVQRILEEVAEQASREIPWVLPEPMPVTVRELGESAVNFTVRLRMQQFVGRGPSVTEMYHRFYERLRAEGIEIPFPTRTLYLRQEDASTAAAPTPPSR
jgi:small-conductance mechanosensitive channel